MDLLPVAKIKRGFRRIASSVMGSLGEETDFGVDVDTPSSGDVLKTYDVHWLQSLLDYDSYSPKGYFRNKDSCSFVFECATLVGADDNCVTNLVALFQDVLPVGSNLQCLLIADHRIDGFLSHWQSQITTTNPMLQKLGAHRRQSFIDNTLSKDYPMRMFRVILSYSQSGILDEVSEAELLRLKKRITSQLNSAGLFVNSLDSSDLLQLLHNILYPDSQLMPVSFEYDPLNSISRQLVNPGGKLKVFDEHLEYHSDNEAWQIKSFSLKSMPRKWNQGLMSCLIGDSMSDLRQIPCPFMIHYGVHILPESSLRTKMRKAERIESQSTSPIAKKIPSLARQAEEWSFARSRLDCGDKFIETSFSVILSCPAKDGKLIDAEQKLLSMYKSNGFQLKQDKYIQLPSFLSVLPMSWGAGWWSKMSGFNRMTSALSYQPGNLMPLQGEWTGNNLHGMLLTGRRGQVFNWSPFDTDGNYNAIVIGTPGSGKSVFMQDLMVSTLRRSGKVFVLDVGRSFEKTCLLLGGSFLSFEAGSNLCINPFSTIVNNDGSIKDSEYSDYLEDTFSYLTSVLAAMAAPSEGCNDRQKPKLAWAIKQTWKKHKQETTITRIAETLLRATDNTAKELGDMLYNYTKEGAYGRFFEGKANVDLGSDLTVIEFEELKNRKDLQCVIVQIIIIQISNRMFAGDRITPFNIVLDEAWDLLRGKSTSSFIEAIARKARKYKGGLIIGTQTVHDLFASPGASAAMTPSCL